jgi:hypothetical protein
MRRTRDSEREQRFCGFFERNKKGRTGENNKNFYFALLKPVFIIVKVFLSFHFCYFTVNVCILAYSFYWIEKLKFLYSPPLRKEASEIKSVEEKLLSLGNYQWFSLHFSRDSSSVRLLESYPS